ncbi:uncharacterized protein [Dermacentor albipictus]|uniref:uncharacterized protein isoform X4 n=1 Tax=Dermacentor albipictus TaxID=60249 RepID=UPI0031FD0890
MLFALILCVDGLTVQFSIFPRSKDFSDHQRVYAIAACLIFVGLMCLMTVVVLGITTEADDDLDDLGGGGGGDGGSGGADDGASSPKSSPAGKPPQTTFTELICTVSAFAVFSTMYPPDGLCHCLFYWNVVVSGGTMRGVEVSTSWEVFKKEMIKHKNTSGGISFDSRYVTAASVRSVEKELNDLTTRNIMHYGVLNMLATPAKVHVLWQRTKALLKELKTIQGNDPKKRIILAMGLYDYGSHGEYYGDFTILFREAVEESGADTVIAISSVGWSYHMGRCECTPPSVWDTEALPSSRSPLARKYPDLRRHAALMSKRQSYSSKVKTGLSFELATLVYNTTQSYQQQDTLDVALLYSECNLFFTTNYDVVPCKNVSRLTGSLVHPDVAMASAELQPSLIFIFEDKDTLEKKCEDLARPSTYLRPNMAILLLNVHLGDYSVNACGDADPLRADPFWRIRVVKRALNIT